MKQAESLQPGEGVRGPEARSFEFAVAAAGVGIFEIDLDTGRQFWSDITLQIHGLPAGSAAPDRHGWRARFLHPEDAPRADARAAEFAATGRPYELVYRIHRAGDGAQRWLHTRMAYADAARSRVVGMTLDVTANKGAEERAHHALLALDISATQVGFGFGYRDVLSDTGEWSTQLKQMFGLAPDAPTPTRDMLVAMVDEADRERVRAEMLHGPVAGTVRSFEYGVHLPGGVWRAMMTRAVVLADAHGRPWRYCFVVVDVTETRAQARQMAELLERLQMATEASGVGTWDRDPQQPGGHWDATTLRLFGMPADAPAPTQDEYLQRVHPEDRARVLLELNATAPRVDYEFRVVLPDGQVRWLITRGRSRRGPDGSVQRRTGICYDVTEQRQAQAALQAQQLAEKANAAKTEFLSRMSHELRTPLNAVLGFAQVMALDNQDPLSAAQRARVGHIQTAGWHLLALINDVLDLARIEARELPMNLQTVALGPVLAECLALNAGAAAQRRVQQQGPADVPALQVRADPTRLKQVLLNLLSNAVKYNCEGGHLVVAVQAQTAQPGEVLVSVTDSGLGLTPEQLAHLFEPFNRLGREHGAAEGTGIGLALSRLIAQQMGGRLEAHSVPGGGSRFSLVLPAA